MAQCKVCSAAQRRDIEALIVAESMSYETIAEKCREMGLSVSHMSIKRHVDAGHVEGYRRGLGGGGTAAGLTADEIGAEIEALQIEIPDVTNAGALRQYAAGALKRIAANQLAIIEAKQKRYMQGAGRYPQAEINGLQSIVKCLDTLIENKGNALDTDQLDNKNQST
jgi:hypothetical protein